MDFALMFSEFLRIKIRLTSIICRIAQSDGLSQSEFLLLLYEI